MRGPAGPKLRHLVQEYLTVVVDDEWPAMQRGEESTRAAAILAQLRSALFLYRFRGPLFTDVLERVNSLDDARRDRLINGNSGLQPVAWFVLLAGSALTICSCLLFAVPDLRLHALMTALVGASIALVLFLIVSFDYPFRGAVSISPRAFQAVQSDITQQEASPDPTPAPSAERPVPKPTLRAR
jgi:hypothetical protein